MSKSYGVQKSLRPIKKSKYAVMPINTTEQEKYEEIGKKLQKPSGECEVNHNNNDVKFIETGKKKCDSSDESHEDGIYDGTKKKFTKRELSFFDIFAHFKYSFYFKWYKLWKRLPDS